MWMVNYVKKLVAQLYNIVHDRYVRIAFAARFKRVSSELKNNRFTCSWEDRWPCLNDATGTTGFDAHYIYHPAWAARRILEISPEKHVDIASKLDFATMLSAFLPVDFYDYRPAEISLSGLRCCRADLTALPFEDSSIVSLSCMHVVEHVGLERYGDPFDPQGDLKAIRELTRVLANGGSLYFVVPLGAVARIQYNAHRIYTYQQILSHFPGCLLKNFAFVTDEDVYVDDANEASVANSHYGCGCFHFMKQEC